MNTPVTIAEILASRRGITAVIGSGGKSTLLTRGATALAEGGARAVLATTTHMLPPAGVGLAHTIAELDRALDARGVAAIGELDPATGKLSSPACGIDELAAHADYVLVEADGSKRLPLKAHAAWEPVIPARAARTILVVGAAGFMRPIAEVVHRPELFCHLTGAAPTDLATPELVARAMAAEALVREGDLVIVNQVDALDGRRADDARSFARELGERDPAAVHVGSLREDRLWRA